MRRLWLPAAAVGVLLLEGAALAVGVRPNLTPSLPVGLWRLRPITEPVRRGQAVEFCLPPEASAFAQERGYIGRGTCPDGSMPLLKPVAAVAGDTVEVTRDDVAVNGASLVPAGRAMDSRGRPLSPMQPGIYLVPPGQVWCLSQYNESSFDSRYLGALPEASLLRVATPLLTF